MLEGDDQLVRQLVPLGAVSDGEYIDVTDQKLISCIYILMLFNIPILLLQRRFIDRVWR